MLMIALKVLLGLVVAVLTALGLIVLFFGSILAPMPLTDAIDRERFIKLDENTKKLYEQIRAKSVNEDWKYSASCEDQMAGSFATGSYYCTTKISTEFMTADSADLIRMHDKYFHVINSADFITPYGNLNKLPLLYFGKQFVVSYAEQQYTLKSNPELYCTYFMQLEQASNSSLKDQGTGMPVIISPTKLSIEFRCEDKATGNWYGDPAKTYDF